MFPILHAPSYSHPALDEGLVGSSSLLSEDRDVLDEEAEMNEEKENESSDAEINE